jgi:CheY-specific phosphatase CheX
LTETAIHEALHDSVVEVLEKMFFIEATGGLPAGSRDPESVFVQLNFDGDPPGAFRMSLERAAAAVIAADFLGEDAASVSGAQIDEVAKELANMICGAVLSRIESSVTFRLAAPDLIHDAAARHHGIKGTVCTVETGNGILTAAIDMERVCSTTERSAS